MPGNYGDNGFLSLEDPNLQMTPEGRAFIASMHKQVSGIPEASLSGPSSVGSRAPKGMGGTEVPSTLKRATRGVSEPATGRAAKPLELQALIDSMQNDIAALGADRPTAVEPVLERDTQVPYWLRNYAEKEGLDKGPVETKKSKSEIIDSNPYLKPEEKNAYKAY